MIHIQLSFHEAIFGAGLKFMVSGEAEGEVWEIIFLFLPPFSRHHP
jgi:hypothetical protein